MTTNYLARRGGLLLMVLLATAAAAQQGEAARITVEPVAGSVWVLHAPDASNIVVCAGDDGILMIDDQEGPTVEQVRAALAKLSTQPLRFVVNTHVHADHTGGNEAFGKQVSIVAHRNVRERMVNGPDKRPPEAWPTVTYDGAMNLHFNGEGIRIVKLPAGHTDGDSVVFFTKSNVVHMGDVFVAPAASYVDRTNGGTILGLIEALEFVLPQIPADAKVIPGHGPTSSRADVARGLEVLKQMKTVVAAGISAGKTMEQLVAEKPFEQWKGQIVPWGKTDSYVGRFYRELTGTR